MGVGTFFMPIQFEILESEGTILIDSTTDAFPTFSLSMDKFWGWVERNGLNGYCEDYYDPSAPDCHGQNVGTLSREAYYNLHYELIKQDLIDYLTKKGILKTNQ